MEGAFQRITKQHGPLRGAFTKERRRKMSERDLTPEEMWLYMPKWKKALLYLTALAMFLGSTVQI